MPTYDYRCAKCGETIEVWQSFSDAPLTKHEGCGGALSKVLGAAGIVLNKNAIPFDPAPPSVASGIRVGTPCVTTQGMGEEEMRRIARLIATAVTKGDADPEHAVSKAVRAEVTELVTAFPAYPRP